MISASDVRQAHGHSLSLRDSRAISLVAAAEHGPGLGELAAFRVQTFRLALDKALRLDGK